MGEAPLVAALNGSKEIGFTILSMTLSLAAVFIPILFMGGLVGRLLHEFAVTIGTAILVSGFVSLTLTPMLGSRFLHHRKNESHGPLYQAFERIFDGSLDVYKSSLAWSLRHRWVIVLATLLTFLSTPVLSMVVGTDFVPKDDQSEFEVTLILKEGTTLTFTVIFGKIAGLPTDGAPPFLFYLAGIITWSYFANSLNNASRSFVSHAHLLSKVYFHRLVVPISAVISTSITFGIHFGIFLALLTAYSLAGTGPRLTGWTFLAPVLLLMSAGYGLGAGIIVCALTTRYRDLAHLTTWALIETGKRIKYPLDQNGVESFPKKSGR